MIHPVTPDRRYFVVRGRLWRMSDPALSEQRRALLTKQLMTARRAVGAALRADDSEAEKAARRKIDRAKRALGERGEAEAPPLAHRQPPLERRAHVVPIT